MPEYRWHFAVVVRENKRSHVALLTQNGEPIFAYAVPPGDLRGADPLNKLDHLVQVAMRYTAAHKLQPLLAPSWTPNDMALWLRDPILVEGSTPAQKRTRYEMLVKIRNLMPQAKESMTHAPHNLVHAFGQYARQAIVSRSSVNVSIQISAAAAADLRLKEAQSTKQTRLQELKERIARGEAMQAEWIQANGGPNMTYESHLLKYRTELEKLEPNWSQYVFTDDDALDLRYARALEIVSQGLKSSLVDGRWLGKQLRKDQRLHAWLAQQEAPPPPPGPPITVHDIADFFSGKVLEKRAPAEQEPSIYENES